MYFSFPRFLLYVKFRRKKRLTNKYRHIFTGIAAYDNLTWCIWLQYCRDGKQDLVELEWPSTFTSMPVVVGVKSRGKVL